MTKKVKKISKKTFLWLILLLVAFVSLFPVLYCVSASLRTQSDLFQNMFPFTARSLIPEKFTLENFRIIFTEYEFWKPIRNSVIVTVSTIILGCLCNSLAAFSFTCFDFKGKKLLYLLILVSFMVPFEAIAIPLYNVALKFNILDTFAGLVLPSIADGLVIFLFVQFFKDIPAALVEAARIDGASWPKIFFKIITPLSKPVFVTAGLMFFMAQWNAYMWPLLAARPKEIRTVQIAITDFYGEFSISWTYIYAASLISILIPICLFLPFQKYFVEGITAGSTKG